MKEIPDDVFERVQNVLGILCGQYMYFDVLPSVPCWCCKEAGGHGTDCAVALAWDCIDEGQKAVMREHAVEYRDTEHWPSDVSL